MRVQLSINGEKHEADVEPRLLLVHLIRDVLRLTGTHIGCDTTHCGACTVLLEGRPVKSCTMFAVQANGKSLMTVEGLEQNGKLHPLQEGFMAEHDPLPVVVDPRKALAPGAPVLRTDKKDKKDNHIWHWEWGDRAATDRAMAEADVTVKQDIYIPRIHVASIETCGCVAHFDKVNDKLTVWMTTQAPHAIRTVFALVAGHVGLEAHKIRIISPDIGGGFGGKVPVYPGYVIAVAASVLTGKPVKWIEDRMENLQADSFARDYHITAELAAQRDGTLTALRIKTLADHGYTDAAANPSKFPAGLFHICTGSYDLKAAHVEVDGV